MPAGPSVDQLQERATKSKQKSQNLDLDWLLIIGWADAHFIHVSNTLYMV